MDAFKDFKYQQGDVVCLNGDSEGRVRMTVSGRILYELAGGAVERCYRCIAFCRHKDGWGSPHERFDYAECELMPAPEPKPADTRDRWAERLDKIAKEALGDGPKA